MSTNKPEIKGVILRRDASCTSTWNDTEPLIRLSDYEALQAECEKLRKASSELANWCFHEVGVDIELTPGLKQVMDITGVIYDEE